MIPFEKSVFINCPFDKDYFVMMQSMIFTVLSIGYYPRLAMELSDSSIIRLEKITELIRKSKLSIHDLSMVRASKKGEYSRLNMPFEFGLDFGCKKYSEGNALCDKKFLVLGGIKYEYMKALSDISGIDIQYHENKNIILVKKIRNWFVSNEKLRNIPSPNEIWSKLCDFNFIFLIFARSKGYQANEIFEMPLNEQFDKINEYTKDNPYK